MSFDMFVQSCIILKRMTDVFKKYDDDRDGFITLSFEEFLTGEFCYPWVWGKGVSRLMEVHLPNRFV